MEKPKSKKAKPKPKQTQSQSQRQSIVIKLGEKPKAKKRSKKRVKKPTPAPARVLAPSQSFAQVVYPPQVPAQMLSDNFNHLNRLNDRASHATGNLLTAPISNAMVGHESVVAEQKINLAEEKRKIDVRKSSIKTGLEQMLRKKVADDAQRKRFEIALTERSNRLVDDVLTQIAMEAEKDSTTDSRAERVGMMREKSRKKSLTQRAVDDKMIDTLLGDAVDKLIAEQREPISLAPPTATRRSPLLAPVQENPLFAVGTADLVAMGEAIPLTATKVGLVPLNVKTGLAGGGGAEEEEEPPMRLTDEQQKEMIDIAREFGYVGGAKPMFPSGFKQMEDVDEEYRRFQQEQFDQANPQMTFGNPEYR